MQNINAQKAAAKLHLLDPAAAMLVPSFTARSASAIKPLSKQPSNDIFDPRLRRRDNRPSR